MGKAVVNTEKGAVINMKSGQDKRMHQAKRRKKTWQ